MRGGSQHIIQAMQVEPVSQKACIVAFEDLFVVGHLKRMQISPKKRRKFYCLTTLYHFKSCNILCTKFLRPIQTIEISFHVVIPFQDVCIIRRPYMDVTMANFPIFPKYKKIKK